MRRVAGVAALVGLAAICCARRPKMTVELDVFSGRPNPEWELSSEASGRVSEKVGELSRVGQPVPEPGLGYRGFILRDGKSIVRVFQSRVTVEAGESSKLRKTYVDSSGIEADLAEEARQHGYGELVQGILPSK